MGKTFVLPVNTTGLQFSNIYEVQHIDYRAAEMTPLQKLIAVELKKAGYQMYFVKQQVQIGGGLGSMDGEIKFENRDYIKISW